MFIVEERSFSAVLAALAVALTLGLSAQLALPSKPALRAPAVRTPAATQAAPAATQRAPATPAAAPQQRMAHARPFALTLWRG